MIFFQELWGYVSGLLTSGVSLSPKSFAFRKLKFKSVRAVSWLIQAIQAVTNATSVSTSQSCRVRYFDQYNHHWNLRSVLKPSPTSLKSQDTLNIFRRTRGYPSVLRKVWPVYCSSQSWRFDSLRSYQDAWAVSGSHLLHYGGKKQCKKWSKFPRKLFCFFGGCFVYLKELYKLSNFIEEIFMVIVEQKIKGVKIAYRESHSSFVRV